MRLLEDQLEMDRILETDENKLMAIFMPHATEKMKELKDKKYLLAHYSSAPVVKSIIENRNIWLRNARLMNDISEIEYGLSLIRKAFSGEPGIKLQQATEELNSWLGAGLIEALKSDLNDWGNRIPADTYIMCLTEHSNSENLSGRLSMWRAYGQPAGVAMVLNVTPFSNNASSINVFSTPVIYADQNKIDEQMLLIAENIEREKPFLKEVDGAVVFQYLSNMFLFAALAIKHPGFREEKEWRVIYMPKEAESDHMQKAQEIIQGKPQTIYKFPFKNQPETNLSGVDLAQIIDHLIIGPVAEPKELCEAFTQILKDAGIENPTEKIRVSNIPLRS